MASGLQSVAGVAVRPVMDLSDRRVIAYQASPRTARGEASPMALLDAALSLATAAAPAPLLVNVHPSLLVSPTFDPIAHIRAAKCAPSEVVWMLPEPRRGLADEPDPPETRILAAAVRRTAATLRGAGFRVGLDGVGVLTVSWAEVVDTRPAFLLMEPELTSRPFDDAYKAALAGLLAFAGRLGARLVAQGIDSDEAARHFMDVGVFYGIGDHLHGPVVLDDELAVEGDVVVRPSWFRERAVRRLSAGAEDGGVHFLPKPPRPAVIDDRRLAGLLTEWSGELANVEDPDAVLTLLADIVPRVVSFDRLAIFEADWDRYVLGPKVLIGEELQPLVSVTHTLNTGITGWAFLQGTPYRCGRTTDHPEAAPIPGQETSDESMLVIPLTSGDRRLGVLDLWRDGADRFSDEDLERAILVGQLGADAWRSAELRAELAERVVTDNVTGLLNKRWWDELASREAAQAIRTKSSIAVLLVDLDGFKAVNDSHGHASGDIVLKHVARALATTVRSGDAVIRYGGDEFILLLRDCDEAGAIEVATEVQVALARVPGPGGGESPVTASIGISLFPEHGPTLEDVAINADTAMYRAKAAGRDQVVCYSPAERDDDVGRPPPLQAMPSQIDSTLESAGLRPHLRQELEDQYRRLEAAQQVSRIGSFEMDLGSATLEWSSELRRILCVADEEEPALSTIVDRIHPEDLQRYAEALRLWVEAGTGNFELGFRFTCPHGHVRSVYMRQLIRELDDGRRLLTGTFQELANPTYYASPRSVTLTAANQAESSDGGRRGR